MSPIVELEDKIATAEGDERLFLTLLLAMLMGKGKRDQNTLDNKEFPEWHPKGAVDVL